MSNLDYEIRGLEDVQQKYATAHRNLRGEMETATRKAVTYVHGQVPGYPPPPATSTYRRTGTLGRSVTSFSSEGALSRVEPMGSVVQGVIGTAIGYAPWVIDANRQAGPHRGRWYTLQSVVRGAWDGVKEILREGLRGVLR